MTADTVNTCEKFCAGYTYMGVENHGECYCSNTLPASAVSLPASSCTATCSGDATQMCGGTSFQVGVWKFIPYTTTPTYTSIGCFFDSYNRVLPSRRVTPSARRMGIRTRVLRMGNNVGAGTASGSVWIRGLGNRCRSAIRSASWIRRRSAGVAGGCKSTTRRY